MHREFVYVGDPVPELNEQEHAAFLMNIHKSILLSLEKRKLLTHSQRERCLVELEKQYSREQKSIKQSMTSISKSAGKSERKPMSKVIRTS